MNRISVATQAGRKKLLRFTEVETLAGNLRGSLLTPSSSDYDSVREVWNGMIDRRPALIARCAGVADVRDAVRFGMKHRIRMSVRGAGHNIAGTALCDGGLVIDLSAQKGIFVDPASRTVHVQPGVTWGELDRETLVHGGIVPGGIVSTTGISGLTLGGGFGWLTRKYGFTCDNLASVDLVTADGGYLRASAGENPDLFWGIRGAGGNFGVVTSFRFRMRRMGSSILGGMVVHPFDRGPEVLRLFREITVTASEDLTCLLILRKAPPLPALPKEVHGRLVAAVAVCHTGALRKGEQLLRPLRKFSPPWADLIRPMPFSSLQTMLDAAQPPGRQYYWKSAYLNELREGAPETMLDWASRITSPQSAVLLMHLGGAAARVPRDATAAGQRTADYILNIASSWLEPGAGDRHIQWTRGFWQAMLPFCTGGVYVNFLTDDADERSVRAAYGEKTYARLEALKSKYDPENIFRSNQNIRPKSAQPRR